MTGHVGDTGHDTQYGFIWGPAHVQRLCSADDWGVVLCVQTPRESVEIRVTPSGLIRIGSVTKPVNYGEDKEVSKLPPPKSSAVPP